ncbi:MAG TPA: class I SAM-dependent methyltransferase [Ktedonobacterales bacterium]
MDCCQCQGIEGMFNQREAKRSLKTYRRKGPARSTRILLDALRAQGVESATLLDIGGGIGAIQLNLLDAGVTSATDVDASTAYLEAAREEAAREGFADRVTYHHGNFVDLAPSITPADIVTLDRVICCYHDLRGLVSSSASKAQRLYGLVYPRDSWLTAALAGGINLFMRLQRSPFRFFPHRNRDVEALLHAAGLQRRFHGATGIWQVAVYARA